MKDERFNELLAKYCSPWAGTPEEYGPNDEVNFCKLLRSLTALDLMILTGTRLAEVMAIYTKPWGHVQSHDEACLRDLLRQIKEADLKSFQEKYRQSNDHLPEELQSLRDQIWALVSRAEKCITGVENVLQIMHNTNSAQNSQLLNPTAKDSHA